MKLLLDIGNSAVKWALAEADSLVVQGSFRHCDGKFFDLAGQAWSGIAAPGVVVAVNVGGGTVAAALQAYAAAAWQLPVSFVHSSEQAFGIRNAYRVPAELGDDRWVAMIAAHRLAGGAVCVIDCGTAVTLDVVDDGGQHRGGLILPGVSLLGESLQLGTAGISIQQGNSSPGVLASGTAGGVINGAEYLLAAALDRIVEDIAKEYELGLAVLMTGGDAARLLARVTTDVQHVTDLVFQGLMLFADGGN